MIDSVGKDTLNDAAQWESGPHGWVSANSLVILAMYRQICAVNVYQTKLIFLVILNHARLLYKKCTLNSWGKTSNSANVLSRVCHKIEHFIFLKAGYQ